MNYYYHDLVLPDDVPSSAWEMYVWGFYNNIEI